MRQSFSACVYCMQLCFHSNYHSWLGWFEASNRGNYCENATACSKRTLKTTVAMQFLFSKKYDKGVVVPKQVWLNCNNNNNNNNNNNHIVLSNLNPNNTCHQFHQRFTRTFFVRIFCQSQNVTKKSCRNDVHTKNSYVKTLMKLTPVQFSLFWKVTF